MNLYEMDKEREELEKYADMEGTEKGELCHALLHVANYPDYMGYPFRLALEEEILDQLKMFKEKTRVQIQDRFNRTTAFPVKCGNT